MRTTLPAATAALMLLTAAPRTPDACSCLGQPPERHVEQAQHVFLARAGKLSRRGKRTRQPLTVLHTLKGKPGKVYPLSRPAGPRSTCDRSFKEGEVALVFVTRGSVSICGGNYDLEAVQLKQMDRYLKAGRQKTTAPGAAAIGQGLAAALKGYLHGRPRVPVTLGRLHGKKARIGKTELYFTRKRLKHSAELHAALRAGPLLYLAGRYNVEGYDFRVLLLRKPGKAGTFETLARWGAEQQAAPIPGLSP